MDTPHLTFRFKEFKERTSRLERIYRTLSPERVLALWLFAFLSIALLFSAMVAFNSRFLIKIPAYGGEVREGIVGTPRFINPVLAVSEQDEDLTTLVYAGLTKRDEFGNNILDMADSIEVSEDGLRYKVTLKPDARFHDGKKVTTDDIIYTVNLIQNPNIKSPHRIHWEGITMEKISDTELDFSLKRPYPLFMETLGVGILPKHLWKNLTDEQFSLSDYNIHAIGSGPYAIKKITSTSGIPNAFTLVANKDYTLGRPFIDTIIIRTYPNERYALQAFNGGDIQRIHGISPEAINSLNVNKTNIHTSLLPRTFTVFFNSSKANPLAEKKVRQALQMAIDKDAIVRTVLQGYGKTVNVPYPFDDSVATSTFDPIQAKTLLESSRAFKTNNGTGTIKLTLSTANTEEMKKVAEMIKTSWDAIGIETTLAVYEVTDLNQSVIKERNFEVLLFGSIVETPADLYAFWHSSQRNYPGLNISNYASKDLDRNLEIIRNDANPSTRATAYEAVKSEFTEEVPGIFLFAPSLIYIANDKANVILPKNSIDNSSRFALVHTWHRYTEKVWPKTYYKQLAESIENIIH